LQPLSRFPETGLWKNHVLVTPAKQTLAGAILSQQTLNQCQQNHEEIKMKHRIVVFTTVALCSCVLLGYASKLQAQTPAQKLERLSQVLNLSPQQKVALLPILQAEAPKIEAIKNNPGMPPGEKAEQIRSIHQQADPQVETILSAQQYKEWQVIRNHEIEQALQH
jgi:hypothetical protein